MIRVTVAVGTRPEAIKMLPLVQELRRRRPHFSCRLVSTGQHRELLDEVFASFAIHPDADLRLMEPNQPLEAMCARALLGMSEELARHPADLLLVEGDTTTVFASALASFWKGCLVGHVEAGLRSGNARDPFPEEMNRILAGCLADLHFAPTAGAAANLTAGGVPEERVYVTGNTGIDALLRTAATRPTLPAGIPLDPARELIVVTLHRREAFGKPLRSIMAALRELVRRFPRVEIVLPVHPNPAVRAAVYRGLRHTPRILLAPPLSYPHFVALLMRSRLVMTDSGGVQEEAPALGKPVLVLRNTTERPEGVACGAARLVGTAKSRIVEAAAEILENPAAWAAMAGAVNPYGDGRAAQRIAQAILHRFGRRARRPAEFRPAFEPGKRP